MPQFIEEENLFTFLSWISLSLSGAIASMSVGEIFTNELNDSPSSFKFYGSCNLWEELPLSHGLHEAADLATTEVATTSPPEIATTRTYIHQI